MRIYHALSAVGLIALSGCGASTAGFGGVSWAGFNNTLSEIQAADDALEPTADLPTSGAPSYSGLFILGPDDSGIFEVYAGRAELTADFTGDGSIGGDVTDFLTGSFDADNDELIGVGTPVDGSLAVSAAMLDEAGFDLDVDGNVTIEGTDTDVIGTLQAQFQGDDAELLTALGLGTVNVGIENWNAVLGVQQP